MRGRVHNRNRDRGGKPVRRLGVGREHIASGPSGGPGRSCRGAMLDVNRADDEPDHSHADVCSVVARAGGHFALPGDAGPAFAPQQHLAQQYDPPSLPPEIMVPERRPVGRQRAAPPITVVPLDPLLPEPTPTAPAPAPTAPVESKPHPLAEWCGQEANAKAPLCRNVGSPRVQR